MFEAVQFAEVGGQLYDEIAAEIQLNQMCQRCKRFLQKDYHSKITDRYINYSVNYALFPSSQINEAKCSIKKEPGIEVDEQCP